MVLLPSTPECAPWCDNTPHEWADDGHSITYVCRRSIVVSDADRTTELTLERFADIDEHGELVIAAPVLRVNGGEAYPLAHIARCADALNVLTQISRLLVA